MPVRILRMGGGARGPPGRDIPNPTATFMYATSNTTQTILNGVLPTAIVYNTQAVGDNFIGNPLPTSIITIPQNGVYSLMYSVQCRSDNPGLVDLFIRVNGTRLAASSSRSTLKTNEEIVLTCSFLLPFVAGDDVEVMCYAAGCDIDILYVPDNPTTLVPAAPGIITNIFRIR